MRTMQYFVKGEMRIWLQSAFCARKRDCPPRNLRANKISKAAIAIKILVTTSGRRTEQGAIDFSESKSHRRVVTVATRRESEAAPASI